MTRRVTTEQAILVAMGVLIGVMVTLGVMVLIESGRTHDELVEQFRRDYHPPDEEDDEV